MSEWATKPLGEVATFQRGFDLPYHARISGDVPVVSSAGTTDYHRQAMVDAPGVVTGRYGTIGELFFLTTAFWPLNTTLYVRDFHGNDPRFVFYLLHRFDFKSFSGKSGVPGVNRNDLHAELVLCPDDVDEQRAIATALSDVDALLEGLDRLIAKKRDLKQAAMQQLLTGDTRLPGFSGEWETLPLRAIADIRSGGTPSTSKRDFWDGGIPWCTPTDITALHGRKYLTTTERTISSAGLRSSSAELVRPNSVIMTSRATIGECAINTVPMSTNQGFKNLIPTGSDGEYLYYLMTTQKSRLIQLCGGSTFLEVGKKQLQQFEVMLPRDIDEQKAIATILSDMDAEIEALEQRRAKTTDLKQAMMQKLLTGKTRLVQPQVSDEQAEAASSNAKGHNWAINEAVVIATLVKHFGKEDYPLGRKRYTKLSYLLHRHVERQAEGYLKKAAGPYNPQTKYGGPEKIAKQNGYITQHKGPQGHSGFIAADNIAQAEGYFEKWYGAEVIRWLEQFRYQKNDDLEVLATVDMAAVELRASGRDVDVATVKEMIAGHPEWEAKLDRPAFSDANIAEAIKQSGALLGYEMSGGPHA